MRRSIIAGNWKMNKSSAEAVEFVLDLKKKIINVDDREIVVCPPFTALSAVAKALDGTTIKLGAQNLYFQDSGAYTGEISGIMIREVGCQYVIVGHSERRNIFKETNEDVNKKILAAQKFGLIPIVCLGEKLDERESGSTFNVIEHQFLGSLKEIMDNKISKLVIAYEPVWAIGTGKTATPAQAEEIHAFIRQLLIKCYGDKAASQIRILYGGSVSPENIGELMRQINVDGVLVGGASLKADSFEKIVKF